ncbi:MAG: glycosyltransferase [Firmicutes bacterium]|nr:glycosyltransferase [Bacillota bacterium]
METEIRASVAMAVYNGEKYIQDQIDSILERMGPADELVISYDSSTDSTKQIIDDYASKDCRIRILDNQNPGVQNNFNNAVMACRGAYIFLSDQDDVWIGDKINTVVSTFEQTGADIVVHDGYMADQNLQRLPKTIFERFGTYNSPVKNIIKCNYWGCCMAFRSSLRKIVCPFPSEGKIGHDLWIGVLGGMYGKIARVKDCLMMHRLHGNNVSTEKRRALPVVLRHRLILIKNLCRRNRELKKQGIRRR